MPLPSAPGDRITFAGHSTVRIEIGGATLLTDPVLRDRLLHLRRHAPHPRAEVTNGIDAVLLSHLHSDHLDVPSLRTLDPGTRLIVPRGAVGWLARQGFERVEGLSPGETVEVGDVEVRGVRAVHAGGRWPVIGPRAEPLGFELRGSCGVYFAGDTALFSEMAELAGRIDVALLPVWGWGTTLGSGHLDPRSAAKAAALIRPRVAVPIHWGTLFPVGRARRRGHLLREPPREFAAHVGELAPDVKVRILEPGDSLGLAGS